VTGLQATLHERLRFLAGVVTRESALPAAHRATADLLGAAAAMAEKARPLAV